MSNECPLGIWRFTDRSIRNMNRLVDKTRMIGIEYGAIIEGELTENGEKRHVLNIGTECTGSECTVELSKTTKKDYIGEFHTHPSGSAKPSPADLRRFESIGNVICIGAPQNRQSVNQPKLITGQNKINCYNRRFSTYGPELAKRRTEILNEIIQNIERHKVFTEDDRRRRDMILQNDFNEFSPDQCKL